MAATEESCGTLLKSQIMAVTQPTVINMGGDKGGVSNTADGTCYSLSTNEPHAIVCTTGEVTHALTHEGANASEDGTGRGTPIVLNTIPSSYAKGLGHNKDELIIAQSSQWNADFDSEKAFTLNTMHDPQYLVHPTLNTTHFGKHFGCNQHVNELGTILSAIGRPRRLTPLECERLMSWPDQWTATGRKEDGTEYALSDTARYRLCGNGVGSVCVAWFAQRLAAML